MKPHLFLLTIGPVQSFIAQARKTQDLFAGSRLISHLASWAFERFTNEVGEDNVTLLFPAFKDAQLQNVQSNPNRFAALVEASISADALREIGTRVKAAVIQEFVSDSLARMQFLSPEAKGIATAQLANHLEIFWAATPIAEDKYSAHFKQLESYINSIKNFRDWQPLPELGRKCGVDGQRNVVVYRKNNAEAGKDKIHKLFQQDARNVALIETADERQVPIWSLEPGEGLSAVSYAKRRFQQIAHNFPSTARVCLMNVIDKIKDWEEFSALEEGAKSYLLHSDDQLLFDENINLQVFKSTGMFEKDNAKAERAVAEIKVLHQALTARMELEGKTERLDTKYYAIMVFDGDQMGKWLGGQHLKDDRQLMQFQMKMRDLLRDYGIWAMDYLKAPLGKAVYAGGDDFLGFINVNHLFKVIETMRKEFDQRINQPLQKEKSAFKVKDGIQFTFSAGIAIGHYKQPLGMVLDEARAAEKAAKDAGRNAFAISVMRHSGGVTRSVQQFGKEETLVQCLSAMETIQQQLASKNFSNKFIHNIIAETRYWKDLGTTELFKIELRRLLGRAKNKAATEQDLKAMADAVMHLYESEMKALETEPGKHLDNFISTLRICDFIYRTTNTDENAKS